MTCPTCEELRRENWQLKGALGYAVPMHIPPGDFSCGLCGPKEHRAESAEAKLAELEWELGRYNYTGFERGEYKGSEVDRLKSIIGELDRGKTRALKERNEANDKLAEVTEALRIIAGEKQCLDNLMGDKDIAKAALAKVQP